MPRITDKQILDALTSSMTIYELAAKLELVWVQSLRRRLENFVREGSVKRRKDTKGKSRFVYYERS